MCINKELPILYTAGLSNSTMTPDKGRAASPWHLMHHAPWRHSESQASQCEIQELRKVHILKRHQGRQGSWLLMRGTCQHRPRWEGIFSASEEQSSRTENVPQKGYQRQTEWVRAQVELGSSPSQSQSQSMCSSFWCLPLPCQIAGFEKLWAFPCASTSWAGIFPQ